VLVAASVTTTTTAKTSNFLIPNGTFVVELVLFLIVLGIVAKFILPPIVAVMAERAQAVRASLEASNAGQVQADQLATERRQVLEGARAEARSLLEGAAADAARLVEDARARGLAEHGRAMDAARPGLEADRARLLDEVLASVGGLVVAGANQVIGEPVNTARHQGSIDALVAQARLEMQA
jgi:F-type H+-transporting ATPase subunit b